MNEYDLFDAFGGIDAELLNRSEHKPIRKFPVRKALIAAAAVMALAATALAYPAVKDWFGYTTFTKVDIGEIVKSEEFVGYREGFARIDLNLEGLEDPPQVIAQLRVPTYFAQDTWDYTPDIRDPNRPLDSYYGIWQRWLDPEALAPGEEVPLEPGQYLTYHQKTITPAIDRHGAGYGQFAISIGSDAPVEQTTLTIGDQCYQVYLVGSSTLEPIAAFGPHTDIVWSDGEYAYHISAGGMDLQMLAEIIQSIAPVPMEGHIRDAVYDPIETYYTLSTIPADWVLWNSQDDRYYWQQEWGTGSTGTEILLTQHRDQRTGNDVQSESIPALLEFAREDPQAVLTETSVAGVTVYIVRNASSVSAYWHDDGCVFTLEFRDPDLSEEALSTHIRGLVPVDPTE